MHMCAKTYSASVQIKQVPNLFFEGNIILKLPDDSAEVLLGPGDGYLIESKRAHSWKVLDEKVLLVDVFSPPRNELIENKYAPMARVE